MLHHHHPGLAAASSSPRSVAGCWLCAWEVEVCIWMDGVAGSGVDATAWLKTSVCLVWMWMMGGFVVLGAWGWDWDFLGGLGVDGVDGWMGGWMGWDVDVTMSACVDAGLGV
ncbi:hypothetical protein IAQ61_005670 [Plenodomus lingam]|uniref:uncharacterized protein n=1 Tax=Leptosphaeria maculans TaxID=5022 RepID=UPI003317B668|nr:hypothetical protein IAQ61_005670 [Plenodomus lingam]